MNPSVKSVSSVVNAVSAADLLAAIAESQIGVQEDPPHVNKGAALQKYFVADNYVPDSAPSGSSLQSSAYSLQPVDEGYPWCAAFVSWCIQELARQMVNRKGPLLPFAPPRLCRAFDLPAWGTHAQGCRVWAPWQGTLPQRGDVVIYRFSHCGIVVQGADDPSSGIFEAVEGNTNEDGGPEGYEVAQRTRRLNQVQNFVRLPDLRLQPSAFSPQPCLSPSIPALPV